MTSGYTYVYEMLSLTNELLCMLPTSLSLLMIQMKIFAKLMLHYS